MVCMTSEHNCISILYWIKPFSQLTAFYAGEAISYQLSWTVLQLRGFRLLRGRVASGRSPRMTCGPYAILHKHIWQFCHMSTAS
jgi:hypothetical protein